MDAKSRAPLVLEGDLSLDHGYFLISSGNDVPSVLLASELISYFGLDSSTTHHESVIDLIGQLNNPALKPAQQEELRSRLQQAREKAEAADALLVKYRLLRLTIEPLEGQGSPLSLQGKIGVDSGEIFIESAMVSGFLYELFLEHFYTDQFDPEEADLELAFGRVRFVFDSVLVN